MDSDQDVIDDDGFIFDSDTDYFSPFPNDCSDEIVGIDRLRVWFLNRYDDCPGFYVGSLRNACEKALHCPIIQERCPLLIYIHHDKSLFSNIFCKNIFCSEKLVTYLCENYIVWPWDVTYPSNRDTLIKMWTEIFPNEKSIEFSKEQCPMLIGITRRSLKGNKPLPTAGYEFLPLLIGDTLINSKQKFSLQAVLNELSMFKEDFDDNEQALSYEIITKTGLSWDVIIEICQYLSLNDAINAFSPHILPFLRKTKSKVHILNGCETHLNRIIRKLDSEQIVSLYLNSDPYWLNMIFSSLTMFQKIHSLILDDLEYFEQIGEYEIHFPKLTCLSFRYHTEIGFNIFENALQYLPNSIKRFEIHCTGSLCTHYDIEQTNDFYIRNYSIKYFLLDMGKYPSITKNECFQKHQSCFLMTIIDLIKHMINIQYFRLIIHSSDVENLFDVKSWIRLVVHCHSLKKIILQIRENRCKTELFLAKVSIIQQELRTIRQTVKFEVQLT